MAWKYCKMGYPYMVHERKSDEENKRRLSEDARLEIRDQIKALKSLSYSELRNRLRMERVRKKNEL